MTVAGERSMNAVIQTAFGNANDVLRVGEIAPPQAGPADVVVRVAASGLPRGLWLTTRGLPYIARPAYGVRTPRHPVAGLEFAGTILAVGAEVTSFAVGEPVFGAHHGALAEMVAAPAAAVALKPAALGFDQAAAMPISGVTALQAVQRGRVRRGSRVLVLGASGGVGSFAVQIAKALGADVTGVAGPGSVGFVLELGADRCLDYTRDDPTAATNAFDVVIDIAGNRRVSTLRRSLVPGGRLVIVGGTGGRWTMGFERTVGAVLTGPFGRGEIIALLAHQHRDDLAFLARLAGTGQLSPVVERRTGLSQSASAIEAVGAGGVRGTIVVMV